MAKPSRRRSLAALVVALGVGVATSLAWAAPTLVVSIDGLPWWLLEREVDKLPTLGKLGELWGLSAENKRSAPSAALKVLMDDLIVKASGRMHHGAAFTPWFAKSRAASVVFAEAQEGNTNRRDGRKRA